ncbi:tetratricopeptide repeat protein [Nocardiopsis sp. RSe5-2]|uniref:Tetratricopeptide repeat protein n=1 Tax=Nocardiopsis endophytica TaxID=3018445 RepID=A0ABT4U7C8_9ACTN|nr:tetratricopeptide repeat protein [Nocardiopsis endophytica]MDA2812848.1 tetratricopeptide repeat protein [Nocardiopsis endophytica]
MTSREEGTPGTPGNTASGGRHGVVVQAGTVHGGIHLGAGPAPAPAGPLRAPRAPARMADRLRELSLLRREAHEALTTRTPRIVVLTGTGGVGKTAVAARFLETDGERFADGRLTADLAAFAHSGPADPAAVLAHLLRALGVRPEEVPADLPGRARLFQARTEGRSIALLLDDAASAAQAAALLPGGGAHLTVVTTRLHPAALLARGARITRVRPLPADHAAGLLRGLVGGGLAGAPGATTGASTCGRAPAPLGGPGEAERLAELCGHLPLALCAVAGRLVLRPDRPAARMVEELEGERRRLSALSGDEEVSVRSALDVSYAGLDPPTARLYRLLGLHPGPDASPEAAALLTGTDRYTAEAGAERLVAASLLHEHHGRFAFHDLVRLHARERAEAEEPERERRAAVERLLHGYLRTAVAADTALNPGRWHVGPLYGRVGDPSLPAFPDAGAALHWLDEELPTLEELVVWAARDGHPAEAWQLCEALWDLFLRRRHHDSWFRTHEAGLAAARELGDPEARGRMHGALAAAHVSLHRTEEAEHHHREALRAWDEADHDLGRAAAMEGLGVVELARDAPGEAVPHFEGALTVHTSLGRERGIALMRRRLGEALRDAGRPEEAVGHFTWALGHFTEAGDHYLRTRVLVGLATVHIKTGDFDEAERVLDAALDAAGQARAEMEAARVHALRGGLEDLRGRRGPAVRHLREALTIYRRLGAVEAEGVEQRLAGLERRGPDGTEGAGQEDGDGERSGPGGAAGGTPM